jgi:hypothetical protein
MKTSDILEKVFEEIRDAFNNDDLEGVREGADRIVIVSRLANLEGRLESLGVPIGK